METEVRQHELDKYEASGKPTIYRVLMYIMTLGMIAGVVLIALIFLEKPTVDFTNVPFPLTEQKIYRPGDTIAFVIKRCASRPTEYTLTQTFISDSESVVKRYHIESHDIIVDKEGCEIVSPIARTIPAIIPTGSYHMEFGIAVKGRFRDFIFTVDSMSFDVKSDAEVADKIQTNFQQHQTQVQTTPPIIIYPGPSSVKEKETTTTTTNNTTTVTPAPVENKPVINKILDNIIKL